MTGALTAALAALLPLLWLAWRLSPWASVETEDYAKKTFWQSYWAGTPQWGNNPASQRVHEVGGGRFSALIAGSAGLAVAALSGLCVPLFEMEGSDLPAWLMAGVFGTVIAVAAVMVTWNWTLGWVDVGEHAAEAMHGDKALADGELDPDALAWLTEKGFAIYGEGEAWRMTHRAEDYSDMTEAEFTDLMRSREWMARIILWLAGQPDTSATSIPANNQETE